MKPTTEQSAAIESGEVYTHVAAGPGAGKTRVIIGRIAWLLEQGVDPSQILCVTFTRAAANEVRSRVSAATEPAVARQLSIATYHETSLRELPIAGGLRVASEIETNRAMDTMYSGATKRPSRGLPAKNDMRRCISIWEVSLGEGVQPVERDALLILRTRMLAAGMFPIFDLLPRLYAGLQAGEVRRFEHVLVDEAQDCTLADIVLAQTLVAEGGRLYIVGDMRQAIMGWRYAEPDRWRPPTHQLTRTFRFGAGVADVANRLRVGSAITAAEHDTDVHRIDWSELRDFLLAEGRPEKTAILTRTNADATAVARFMPRVVHVRRDPADPLSTTADAIDRVTEDGGIPSLTIHTAKGREWDDVILLSPSSMDWQRKRRSDPEESRVAFVGATRARKRLVIVRGEPREREWFVKSNGLDDL